MSPLIDDDENKPSGSEGGSGENPQSPPPPPPPPIQFDPDVVEKGGASPEETRKS